MNFFFKILVPNKTPIEIERSVIEIFEAWKFTLASDEVKQQYQFHPDEEFNLMAEGFTPRAFLISPQKKNWCSISPSYEVWFGEAIDVCNLLSDRLNCITLLLLQDDAYGWGYFLYEEEIIDKFHTDPKSPTLREKESGWPDSLQPLDANKEKEYYGNPDIFAKTFNIQSNRIAHYLSVTRRYQGSVSHFEMKDIVFKVLGVPEDLIGINYYDIYTRIEDTDQWRNLIFMRKMTPIEIEWYKINGQDAIGSPPPLWLTRQ